MKHSIENEIFNHYRKNKKKIELAKSLLEKDGYIVSKKQTNGSNIHTL